MHRRQLLASSASAALAASLPTFSTAATESRKKGWAGGSADFHKRFGTHWYYTWTPKSRPSKATEFVPMIKGSWNLNQTAAIKQMGGITHLLGFNEPEREKQGNISVANAVKLWPRLEALAKAKNLRLGSPACSGESGTKWFRAFMKQAKEKGLHMDFIAVHFYRLDASGFEKFVENLADNYDLPVWVTEFNGWNGSEEDNREFLKDSLKFLEKEDYIERYAYFNFKAGRAQALIDADGELTRMGELYREAGS
ncbi:MAG: hypothetical protein ACI8UO_003832 [Verrucomicrobiales bacterium]|jgi:hypothetical protein